jgi:hypothetical protein
MDGVAKVRSRIRSLNFPFRRSGTEIPFWNRTFEEYANGFGSLSSDHWLGLDRVNSYIKRGHQLVLRIVLYHDLCDEKGKCSALGSQAHWWADWDFKVASKKIHSAYCINYLDCRQSSKVQIIRCSNFQWKPYRSFERPSSLVE